MNRSTINNVNGQSNTVVPTDSNTEQMMHFMVEYSADIIYNVMFGDNEEVEPK